MNTNSNDKNFDIELSFLEARSSIKKLQQLSFNTSEFERRYPYSTLNPHQKLQLMKLYLAIRLDLREIAEDLEGIYQQSKETIYGNREDS